MTIGALPLGLGIAGPEDERPVLRLGVQPVNERAAVVTETVSKAADSLWRAFANALAKEELPKAHANDFERQIADAHAYLGMIVYSGGPIVWEPGPQNVCWSAVSDPTIWPSAEA